MQLKWIEEIVGIKDLKPCPDNPRRVSKEKFDMLVKNIETNGYTNRLIVNHDNVVLAGNQRLKALKKLKYELVTVLKSTKPLTKEQEKRINITDNLLAGEWDFDALGNSFDAEQLIEWGMPANLFDVSDEEDGADEKTEKTKTAKKCPNCGEIL
jgi:ParB-like chromosome segregation protein Spo0J